MMIRDGETAVYTIRQDGTGLTRLDPGPQASRSLKWSPDGAYLAFLTATEDIDIKGYTLNLYSFATGMVTQIIKEMVVGGVAWRP